MVNTRSNVTEEQVAQMIEDGIERAFTDRLPELIATEVGRALQETLPEMFTGIRDQLNAMLDERLEAHQAGGGRPQRAFTYRDFSACAPPEFKGDIDPTSAMRWIADIEGVFRTCECPGDKKVRFASNLLRGPAKVWWTLQEAELSTAQLEALTWEEFTGRFRHQYVPRIEIEKITTDFLTLKQGEQETLTAAAARFRELAVFCPDYMANEEMKMERFSSMLRRDIREFVKAVPHTSLTQMIESARRREIEMDLQRKERRTPPAQTVLLPAKKSRPFDSRSNQRGSGQNFHQSQGGSGRPQPNCYKCGKTGHLIGNCRSGLQVCYGCGQMGHIKANCPRSRAPIGGGSSVRAPAPATLRITDGRSGQVAPPARQAQGRAFQLTGEEALVAPKVVTGTQFLRSIID